MSKWLHVGDNSPVNFNHVIEITRINSTKIQLDCVDGRPRYWDFFNTEEADQACAFIRNQILQYDFGVQEGYMNNDGVFTEYRKRPEEIQKD